MKLQSLGVPDEVLWEKAGFTPQEIARMSAMRAESDLFSELEVPAESAADSVSPTG